jgi:uncharacterized protein
MQLPTTDEIEALHKKYATNDEMFQWVYVHCQAVWSIAEQLIDRNNLQVNVDLVRVGCLLHDIGVYPLFDDFDKLRDGEHYITHGIRGDEILQSEGLGEVIRRFASHHTEVSLTKEAIETAGLPLPHQDFLAETPEERLVMYADKFHSKQNPPCFNSYEWYKKFVGKFGDDRPTKFEKLGQEFGIPDIEKLAKQYGHAIRN